MKAMDRAIMRLEKQMETEIAAAKNAEMDAFLESLTLEELRPLTNLLRKCDVAQKTGEDAELTEEEKAAMPLLEKMAEIER